MAYTTHPNQIDSRRASCRPDRSGRRALRRCRRPRLQRRQPRQRDGSCRRRLPDVDEMRAENMEIRRQVAAAAAAIEAQLPVQRRDAGAGNHPRPGGRRGSGGEPPTECRTAPSSGPPGTSPELRVRPFGRGGAARGSPERGPPGVEAKPGAPKRGTPSAQIACPIVNTQMQTCYRHPDGVPA